MRKLVLLVLTGFIFSVHSYAQRKMHLHISFKPNYKYTETNDQITNMDMEFSGDKESLKSLPDGGKPIKKTIIMHVEKETTTGKYYNDSLFAIKTVLTDVETMDGAKPIPPGSTIYSTRSKTGRTVFDSLSAEGMDSEVKEKLLPMFKALIVQIVIPERDLKIGESFVDITPLRIPISGMTLDLLLNTTYKLKSISGNLAYLDVEQTYTMSSESVSLPVKASGTGTGTLIYDINAGYFTKYNLEGIVSMNLEIEGKTMKMKIETTSKQSAKPEAL